MARTFFQAQKEINRRAFKAISDEVPRIKREMEDEISDAIEDAWETSPTVQELKSGGLLVGDLGLIAPAQKLDSIKRTFVRHSIRTRKTRLLKNRRPLLVSRVVFPTRALLSARAGFQENIRADGSIGPDSPLHWLEWLIVRGQSIIIRGSDVVRGGAFGRSGQRAIMGKNLFSQFWKVPLEHSGTEDDNFITRVLENTAFPKIRNSFRIKMNLALRRAARKSKRRRRR